MQGWKAGVKANISVKGKAATCASRVLQGYAAPYSATVAQLLERQGANLVANLDMDEFGMGSYGIHSSSGHTVNPLDRRRVAGGSSSGCAASVADGSVRVAIGTDTGGSVRLPASYCGVIGFKPTYGRFSRWGVISYASSLDTVGILSRSVDDCEKVYGVLNVRDPKDPTSLKLPNSSSVLSKSTESPLNGLSIGVPTHISPLLSQTVLERYSDALYHLESLGATIKPISLNHMEHALGSYYTIACAEASSNLARYDGIRYGSQTSSTTAAENKTANAIEDVRFLFGDVVQRRIMLGSFVLGSSAYSSYFAQSQKIRRLVQQSYNAVFKDSHPITPSASQQLVDFILTPASATTAPLKSTVEAGEIEDECNDDVLTVPISLAGLPAIVLPWNNVNSSAAAAQAADAACKSDEDMPVGMQLVAQFGHDAKLFSVAKVMESRKFQSQ
ncbi:glutaminyl-tRNA synthase (glutamine-hydrolysing) [Chytriomyces confervae]|uniref:Glutamyl-tRNA(Gln) amidotransferase subunit A, mitochondrial n=1 Tax=Chytriomyces confervae TaxID=246404 RepID=A0A507FHW7_9FUNG|nr:Trimeric GatFAB AmidoTransferase(AdT) complex subunit [Chytriomyces hyalinus]TPX76031.1 glutaminyl-tRNA synthase (glutamine-hydrolysing) [Chytriomyces confervae]